MKGKLYRLTDDQLHMVQASLFNQAELLDSYGESGKEYNDLNSQLDSGALCYAPAQKKDWEDDFWREMGNGQP
jgi:hypothetical protein